MAAGPTYEPLATTTLTGAQSSVVFSSIPSTYTDLRIVLTIVPATTIGYYYVQYNSSTATNYSSTYIEGNGSTATSTRFTTANGADAGRIGGGVVTTAPGLIILDIFNYAGSTFKTALSTFAGDQNGAGTVDKFVTLWQSTAAINSVSLLGNGGTNSFTTGTRATLYGITKA